MHVASWGAGAQRLEEFGVTDYSRTQEALEEVGRASEMDLNWDWLMLTDLAVV